MVPGFITSLINLVLGLIELLLGTRLVLKLFAANAATPFVRWIYETSSGLIRPFAGIFPNPVVSGGLTIEFSTIVAMVVYAVIGYLIGSIIATIGFGSRRVVVER